jgi:hypothetical protein
MDHNITRSKIQQFSTYTNPKTKLTVATEVKRPEQDRNITQNSETRMSFTYYSPLVCKITNLSKQTSVKNWLPQYDHHI